jgi:hypothetical protein
VELPSRQIELPRVQRGLEGRQSLADSIDQVRAGQR